MAHVLGHHLVLFQLLQEDVLVEGEDVLQVAKDELLLAPQLGGHVQPRRGRGRAAHRDQE